VRELARDRVKRDAAIAGAAAALVLAVITIAVVLLRGDDSTPPAPEPTPAGPQAGRPPYDAAAFQPSRVRPAGRRRVPRAGGAAGWPTSSTS
jgi:hypothetical protein